MLTTNEFIKEAEKLGYQTKIKDEGLSIEKIFVYDNENSYREQNDSYLFALVTTGRGIDFRKSSYFDSARNRVKLFDLAIDYMNTPDNKRKPENKWYIYWVDIDKTLRFLDKDAIAEPENYNNISDLNIFKDAKHLEESEVEDAFFYQFTRQEIEKLSYKWRPLVFGGLGFTECQKVK